MTDQPATPTDPQIKTPTDADRRMRITLAVIAAVPVLLAAVLAVHRMQG